MRKVILLATVVCLVLAGISQGANVQMMSDKRLMSNLLSNLFDQSSRDTDGLFGNLFGISESSLKNLAKRVRVDDVERFVNSEIAPKSHSLFDNSPVITALQVPPSEAVSQPIQLEDAPSSNQIDEPLTTADVAEETPSISEKPTESLAPVGLQQAPVEIEHRRVEEPVVETLQVIEAPEMVVGYVHTDDASPEVQDSRMLQSSSVEQRKSKYYNGDERHRVSGGSCREFFRLNVNNDCCSRRDDDCYMIHFQTRCYCDAFCNRHGLNYDSNPFDCCPDGGDICPRSPQPDAVITSAPTPTTKYPTYNQPKPPVFIPRPVSTTPVAPTTTVDPITLDWLYCKRNGVAYPNRYVLSENCKKCYCLDGIFKCVSKPCLINATVVEQINSRPSPWLAGNNSNLWGQTLEYGYKNKLGAKLPNEEFRNEKAYYANITDFFYDFRREPYFKARAAIRDQGECGASWAFSTVEVLSDRAAKKERKLLHAEPSVEMLIACTNKFSANNCAPVEIDSGWAYIESYLPRSQGLVDEDCYPLESTLTGTSPRCRIFEPDPTQCVDGRSYNRPFFKSTRAYRVRPNTADIMHEISKNGPVQMVFKVFSDFFVYKSGVYVPSPHAHIPSYVTNPYHAVKVLGWGTQNGIDYWIAANSWGPNWGENGYFKIKRDEPLTEIGKHVYAAWGFYDR